MILGFNSIDYGLHSDYDSLCVHSELDLLVLHPGYPGRHPICCRFRSSGQYLAHVSVKFQFALNIFLSQVYSCCYSSQWKTDHTECSTAKRVISGYVFVFQKVNVFMSVINSSANPFLYFAFMPTFRRAVMKTFLLCLQNKVFPVNDSSTETNTTSNTGASNQIP